ncbi:hypothetical protein ZWY2020_040560 [Hordeum vulgare]|nr:hypothetical protein ZWY2020_040560 [Hordeum vulgare]
MNQLHDVGLAVVRILLPHVVQTTETVNRLARWLEEETAIPVDTSLLALEEPDGGEAKTEDDGTTSSTEAYVEADVEVDIGAIIEPKQSGVNAPTG